MWGLVLVRDLRHSPEVVWEALTDPDQLQEWAPFDASGSLAQQGTRVTLSTAKAPTPMSSETVVLRADRPRLLEYTWGGSDLRWELAPHEGGTRLTLHTRIDRRYIAMGAAGWHLCVDVLQQYIAGTPQGRTVGTDALQSADWHRLHAMYREEFAAEQ